jgi:polysaccharide pyruvyl transferase WcaK-like protein
MNGSPRILLLGEGGSPNLGDAMIRDGLVGLLREAMPKADVGARDWRRGDDAGASLPRRPRLPPALRKPLLGWLILHGRRPAIWPQLARSIRESDIILIGGGELVQDGLSLFPHRLAAVARCARDAGRPYALIACGVEPDGGCEARRLVGEVLAGAALVTVRDAASRENLARWAPGRDWRAVAVAPDPAATLNPPLPKAGERAGVVGVNVLAYANLQGKRGLCPTREAYMSWYIAAVESLRRASRARVRLYTNGLPLDQDFAEALAGRLADPHHIELAPRPTSVEAYLQIVSGCSAILATRLHAAIAAMVCGVGAVGVRWSSKIESFYREIGRADLLVAMDDEGLARLPALVWPGRPVALCWPDGYVARAREHADACRRLFATLEAS